MVWNHPILHPRTTERRHRSRLSLQTVGSSLASIPESRWNRISKSFAGERYNIGILAEIVGSVFCTHDVAVGYRWRQAAVAESWWLSE
jgi:hypothetical protein